MRGRRGLFALALGLSLDACDAGTLVYPPSTGDAPPPPPGSLTRCAVLGGDIQKTMFHGNRARNAWNDEETALVPSAITPEAFGWLWDSPRFDTVNVGGTVYPGRTYASLLYADGVPVAGTGSGYDGQTLSLLFAATSNGFAYAVNARPVTCNEAVIPPGAYVWKTRLGAPQLNTFLDGGIPLGVLATPALDLTTTPPRMYIASLDADGSGGVVWKAYALDLRSGAILPGWPVVLSPDVVTPLDTNGSAALDPNAFELAQRAALNLSPAGDRLYLGFGGYTDHAAGWIIAVDTVDAKVAAAFCAADGAGFGKPNGGVWEPGGPAVDDAGNVYATTGNGPVSFIGKPRAWGNSFVLLDAALHLTATYSPWNYCQNEIGDTDLGADSPTLLPDLRSGDHAHAAPRGLRIEAGHGLSPRSRPHPRGHRHAAAVRDGPCEPARRRGRPLALPAHVPGRLLRRRGP